MTELLSSTHVSHFDRQSTYHVGVAVYGPNLRGLPPYLGFDPRIRPLDCPGLGDNPALGQRHPSLVRKFSVSARHAYAAEQELTRSRGAYVDLILPKSWANRAPRSQAVVPRARRLDTRRRLPPSQYPGKITVANRGCSGLPVHTPPTSNASRPRPTTYGSRL